MALGDNCSSACTTRDHATWGECQRAKNLKVAYCRSAAGLDATAQKKQDRELESYRQARAQGIQPAGTRAPQIEAAVRQSNATGVAFQAG